MDRLIDGKTLGRSFILGTGLILLSLAVGFAVGWWRLSEQSERGEIAVTLSHLGEGVARLDLAVHAAADSPTARNRLLAAQAFLATLYHVEELRRADPETPALRARAGEIAVVDTTSDPRIWRGARLDALAARWLKGYQPPHRHDLGAVPMTDEMLRLWRGEGDEPGLEASVSVILAALESYVMDADDASPGAAYFNDVLREEIVTVINAARDASALSAREKTRASGMAQLALAIGCGLGATAAVANYVLLLRPLKRRILADAGKLARALEAAKSGEKAKSEFLSAMSHELRTPLNGVLGMASLLESTDLDSRQRGFVATIHQSAEILLGIIEDILVFARPDPEKLRPRDAAFAVERLGLEPITRLTPLAALKRVEVVVRRKPDGPTHLVGDLDKLDHIVANLLGNAVKFTEGGRIVVEIAAEKAGESRARLRIAVSDTGAGVAPEHCERIFRLFEQGDQSATRRGGGAGLGLAVCTTLTKLMGGRLGMISEGPGKGSRFWVEVELPVALSVATTARPRPFTGRSALFVSPVPERREVGAEILRELGFATRVAATEDGAWRALREAGEKKPDLVTLDHIPPVHDAENERSRMRAALDGVAILMLMPPGSPEGPHADDPLAQVLIKPPAPGAPEAAIAALLARADSAAARNRAVA